MYRAISGASMGLVAAMLITVCLGSATDAAAGAIVFYDSRTAFDAAVRTSITDAYDSPGYFSLPFVKTDAQMDSVLGQTRYTATGYPNVNIVGGITGFDSNPAYCAGCNGSFTLDFTHTSIGSSKGVYGIAFDFENLGNPPYTAFITFGDGSTLNEPLPVKAGPVSIGFLGVTSNSLISSIALGLPSGAPTQLGFFAEDNLTIAALPAVVPEPRSITLLGTGLVGLYLLGRRRHQAQK